MSVCLIKFDWIKIKNEVNKSVLSVHGLLLIYWLLSIKQEAQPNTKMEVSKHSIK